MSNIYKLIEYIVNNWSNNLSEALAPSIKKQLIDKFKEEAEDYNIKISDKQLSDYIDFFDSRLKSNPNIKEKDLFKYSLQSLIKLMGTVKGAPEEDEDEEVENTPDVVYNEEGITIWNGAKQDNCITYGASQKLPNGSKWCITNPGGGMWATYRYGRSQPTFYLAKNSNLPDEDKLSFVAVQVQNDGLYKFTNRNNNPGSEGPFPWEELINRVPWLGRIPNIKNILKYIPLTKAEKTSNIYKTKPIDVTEWLKMPLSNKEQYLVVRKGFEFFSDISNQTFVSKVLPKIPPIAEMIVKNYGYVDSYILLQEFDSFSPQNQKSIIANTARFQKIKSNILPSDAYPFSAKKAVVKGDILNISDNERCYVTTDEKAVVKIALGSSGEDITLSIFTEDNNYPNVKVNERTGKVLADYPNLDQFPFSLLIKLAKDNILPKESLNKVIEKAKTDKSSAITIKDTDEGQILLDSNVFKAYKIKNGEFKEIPFEDDSVQSILSNEETNESFQKSIVRLLASRKDITTVSIPAAVSLLKKTPPSKRIINRNDENYVLIPNEDNSITGWNTINPTLIASPYLYWDPNGNFKSVPKPDKNMWKGYFDYLRSQNIAYNTNDLIKRIQDDWAGGEKFALANPPLTADNPYTIKQYEDVIYLVNRDNPQESKKISNVSNRVIKANLKPQQAAQILGIQPPAAPVAPAAAAGRRGRPAGGVARQQAPEAPAQGARQDVTNLLTGTGLTAGFNALPTGVVTRLAAGTVTPVNTDRGATRRNGALGARGRVTGVITAGQSKFYVIRLASGTMIGSVAMQPDAQHYIVTTQTAFRIPNANALINTLQQRNLAEEMKAPVIHMHALTRPQELEEIKYLLQTLKK